MSRPKEEPSAWTTIRSFWVDLQGFRGALALAGLLNLAAIGLGLLQPWPMQWIFDRALLQRGPEAKSIVLWAATALLGITLLRVLLEYWGGLRLVAIGHGVSRALRLRIFRKLVELPPAFHVRQKAGDLLMRLMGDAPMVSTMMVESSTNLVLRSVQGLVTILLLLWVDLRLTLTLLVFLPVLYGVARFLAKKLTIATRKQRRKEGELADSLQESIGAAAVIQSLGREKDVVRNFARSNRRSARAGLKTAKATARLGASVESLLSVGLVLTVLLGAWRVLEPESTLSPGKLLVLLTYVRGILKPVRAASKHQARVAKGLACGQRILEVLNLEPAVRQSKGTLRPAKRPETLQFDSVAYRYPDGTQALALVQATLHAGEQVALVGSSGAGKSTLVALMLRLMDPSKGKIRLDGKELADYDLDSLRAAFGVAMQSSILMGMSVRDNLLLGEPEASDDALWEALRMAAALDFVRELPSGLDEELGAGGGSLSGGQQQRLCLARALLRKSPILVVDEPFAHLDSASEGIVRASLSAHARTGGMVIVVTHAPERLVDLDQIWRLENGQLAVEVPTGKPTWADSPSRSVSLEVRP